MNTEDTYRQYRYILYSFKHHRQATGMCYGYVLRGIVYIVAEQRPEEAQPPYFVHRVECSVIYATGNNTQLPIQKFRSVVHGFPVVNWPLNHEFRCAKRGRYMATGKIG